MRHTHTHATLGTRDGIWGQAKVPGARIRNGLEAPPEFLPHGVYVAGWDTEALEGPFLVDSRGGLVHRAPCPFQDPSNLQEGS